MPTVSLPPNPSLEKLRGQARTLQRAVRAGDPAAIDLVARQHPDGAPAAGAPFPLHAAQLAVARSYGFASWPRLKHHLDVIARYWWDPQPEPGPPGTADAFMRLACLTYDDDSPGRRAQAAALLAERPQLASENVWAAAAANDLEALAPLVAADRTLATRPGGPYGWRPLCYLAYSRVDPGVPAERVLPIARLLLDAGADPDEGYLWSGLAMPFTLLTGVFGAGELGIAAQPPHPHSLAFARLLLAAGADPNDGQTLYNRMFEPGNDHLELLFEFGLGSGDGGPWRSRLGEALPSPAELLRDQLAWATAHGQLARVRLLAEHGVDIEAPLADGRTPAEVAALNGRREVVELLTSRGAAAPALDPVDALVAAVMAGDRASAVAASSSTLAQARRRRPGIGVWAAANGRHDVVQLLLDLGFDVNAYGRSDTPVEQPWQTALHEAAVNGDLDLIRLLLAAGADRSARDARFDATPLGWAEWAGQAAAAELLAESEGE